MTLNRRHLFLLILAALALRLPLFFSAFWYDENYTIVLSRLPLARLLEATAGDVHPPLHYLLMWGLSYLGLPALSLRAFSLACSLFTLGFYPRLMDQLHLPARVQWGALVLLAAAPFQIHYATEARMYAFLQVLVVLATYAVLTRRWLVTWLLVVCLAYTHNWGLLFSAALGLLALLVYPREWKRIFTAFGLAALAWLPWAFTLLWQMQAIHQTYWITRVSFGQIFYLLHQNLWTVMLGTFPALVGTSLWYLFGLATVRRLPNFGKILFLAFLPLAFGAIISALWQPVLLYRALIVSSPFLYLLLAAPLSLLSERPTFRQSLMAGILLLPLFISAYISLYYPGNLRSGLWFNDPHPLGEAYRPGDSILTNTDGAVINYLAQYPASPVTLLEQCQPPLGSLTDRTRAAIGYHATPWEDIPAGRVWVIYNNSALSYDCEPEQYQAIIGQTPPLVYDAHTSNLMQNGIWLVEK